MKVNNPVITPEKLINKYLEVGLPTTLLIEVGWKNSQIYWRDFIKTLPYPKLVKLYHKL